MANRLVDQYKEIFNYLGDKLIADRSFSYEKYLRMDNDDSRKRKINSFLKSNLPLDKSKDEEFKNKINVLNSSLYRENRINKFEDFIKLGDMLYPELRKEETRPMPAPVVPSDSEPVDEDDLFEEKDKEELEEKEEKKEEKKDSKKNTKSKRTLIGDIKNFLLSIPGGLVKANIASLGLLGGSLALGSYLGFPAATMSTIGIMFGALPAVSLAALAVASGVKIYKRIKLNRMLKGLTKKEKTEALALGRNLAHELGKDIKPQPLPGLEEELEEDTHSMPLPSDEEEKDDEPLIPESLEDSEISETENVDDVSDNPEIESEEDDIEVNLPWEDGSEIHDGLENIDNENKPAENKPVSKPETFGESGQTKEERIKDLLWRVNLLKDGIEKDTPENRAIALRLIEQYTNELRKLGYNIPEFDREELNKKIIEATKNRMNVTPDEKPVVNIPEQQKPIIRNIRPDEEVLDVDPNKKALMEMSDLRKINEKIISVQEKARIYRESGKTDLADECDVLLADLVNFRDEVSSIKREKQRAFKTMNKTTDNNIKRKSRARLDSLAEKQKRLEQDKIALLEMEQILKEEIEREGKSK